MLDAITKALLVSTALCLIGCPSKPAPEQKAETNPDNLESGGYNPQLRTITAEQGISRLRAKGWSPQGEPVVAREPNLTTTTFVSASGLTIVFEQHAESKVALSSLGQPSKASELLKVRRGSTVVRIYADEATPVSEARRALGVIDDRPASR